MEHYHPGDEFFIHPGLPPNVLDAIMERQREKMAGTNSRSEDRLGSVRSRYLEGETPLQNLHPPKRAS